MNVTIIRRLHFYLGSFIAPSVLFFALTGAAQLFNLHEAHGHYRPAAILEKLSSVHKDQVYAFGHHDEPALSTEDSTKGGAPPPGDATSDDEKPELATLALKSFFLLVSVCLVLSTVLGLWMGLTQTRSNRLSLALIAAGSLIPVGLLIL